MKACSFGKTETPTVVLFADKDAKVLREPYTMDLSQDSLGNRVIEMVIRDSDLRHFIHEINLDPSIFLV